MTLSEIAIANTNDLPPSRAAMEIAIIGAGPRGTVMLERIIANAEEIAAGRPVILHVIDPEQSGAGRVWRTDQPRNLLMNTVAADVTVFTDDTVRCAGPITPGLTQYRWARAVAHGEIDIEPDAETLREARRLEPWSYASRAFQGRYLSWAFHHIVGRAPEWVQVVVHRDRAVSADDLPGGRQKIALQRSPSIVVDALVIAAGHFDVAATTGQRHIAAFADRHGLRYVAPANPAEMDLSGLAAGEPVLLRGLGLSFFDYLALLSVGRGGRFQRTNDVLTYLPSGLEPALWAGSGRGQPFNARAETRLEVTPRYQPTFLTVDVVAAFRQRIGTGHLDFKRDLWPYIAKEAGWVYYRQLLTADAAAVDRFSAAYAGLVWDSQEMTELVADAVPDPDLRWDWHRVDRPTDGWAFADHAGFGTWTRDRLADDIVHSRLGPTVSARKATAAMMRDLRDEIRQVVSHRGIDGTSYRDHVERWFNGLVNYFASGPPASRVEELLALYDAGVVRFVGPDMSVREDETTGEFVASSPAVAAAAVRSRVLIDAHLPLTDVRRATDPLLSQMLATGQCRAHTIPQSAGEPYQTGGLDITEGTQQLVDAAGRVHPARFAYGPPVESVQWVTAIGARPRVNSRTLLQADIIARAALTARPQATDVVRGRLATPSRCPVTLHRRTDQNGPAP